MYGLAEYGISRQHREEIRQEVAAYRLEEKLAREPRRKVPPDWGREVGAGAVRGPLEEAPPQHSQHSVARGGSAGRNGRRWKVRGARRGSERSAKSRAFPASQGNSDIGTQGSRER